MQNKTCSKHAAHHITCAANTQALGQLTHRVTGPVLSDIMEKLCSLKWRERYGLYCPGWLVVYRLYCLGWLVVVVHALYCLGCLVCVLLCLYWLECVHQQSGSAVCAPHHRTDVL